MLKTKWKEKILKAFKKNKIKNQIIHIIHENDKMKDGDFSPETMEARKHWGDIFNTLKGKLSRNFCIQKIAR